MTHNVAPSVRKSSTVWMSYSIIKLRRKIGQTSSTDRKKKAEDVEKHAITMRWLKDRASLLFLVMKRCFTCRTAALPETVL